jgi:hypothetical protein
VGPDFRKLVMSPFTNPRGEGLMLLSALHFAHTAVRDVADEHVLETKSEIA